MKMERQWFSKHTPTAIPYINSEIAQESGRELARAQGLIARICDVFDIHPTEPTNERRMEIVAELLSSIQHGGELKQEAARQLGAEVAELDRIETTKQENDNDRDEQEF